MNEFPNLDTLGDRPDDRTLQTIRRALEAQHAALHRRKNESDDRQTRDRLSLLMRDVEDAQAWVTAL